MNTKKEFSIYTKKLVTMDCGNDGPTPINEVKDIIDKLPIDWSNPNLRIYDPCFGFGTYLFFSKIKLLEYHSESHILNNMLYGTEIEIFRYLLTKKKLKIKNLFKGNFIENEELKNMKFDIIIGNPPYQHPDNKRWKLWPSFIEKSLLHLKDGGILSFITPISWLNGMGTELEHAKSLLIDKNISYVNTNINQYFNNIGENIGYFILENNEYSGKTCIEDLSSKVEIDIRNYVSSDIQKRISLKVFSSKPTTNQTKNDNSVPQRFSNFLSNKKPDLKANKCSLKRSDTFSIEVIHTGVQKLYYDPVYIPPKFFDCKVIVNMSGGYYSNTRDFIFIPDDCVVPGRNVIGIYCIENDAHLIETILKSKLYRFVINTNKSGGFNTAPFKKLPKFTKELLSCKNDIEIYNYFQLTKEEIDYVENFNK